MRNRLERIWKISHVDFKKRYSNDLLGLFWALLKPLFRMAVYYFVLSKILGVREENHAFILFSGLIIWMTFAESTNRGINLLRAKSYLISSIQLNKLDIFIANVITVFISFIFNLTIYTLCAYLFGITFTIHLLYLPIILLIIFMFCMGFSLILSIINLFVKDIQHLWSMILLFGFWTAGVFARSDIFITKFPPLKFLHPFVGIISNSRNILLHSSAVDIPYLWFSFFYGAIILVIGLFVFDKYSHLAIEKI